MPPQYVLDMMSNLMHVVHQAANGVVDLIVSIKNKALKQLYLKADRSKLSANMIGKIEEILFVLSTAESLEQIDQPGFRLHALSGDRVGQHAVTVRANWRIVFRFEDGDIHDVDFVDYH